MDPIFGCLDPEISVFYLGSELGDLLRGVGKRLAIMQLQQGGAIALRQAVVIARSKHDATCCVMFLKCPARVRTYLDHENVADGEFRTNAEKRGSYAAAIGVGELREIASPHENFCLRQPSAQLRIPR